MGIVRMGVPEELVLFMQRAFNVNVFIETGTFKGDTSCWAANHFRKVITVELSKELSDAAAEKYRHLQNVQFRCGDSSEELTEIVRELDQPAVFWLDAHHCSFGSAGAGSRAPILAEVEAIGLSPHHHFILIDDARLFLAPPPDPHPLDEYPDISLLLEQVNRHKKHYVVIYDDVIICVPDSAREEISRFCKQETTRIDRAFWAQKEAAAAQAPAGSGLAAQLKTAAGRLSCFCSGKKALRQKQRKFEREFEAFQALNKAGNRFPCRPEERYPCLDDDTATTSFDRHYVLHPAWATRILAANRPPLHIDVSSTLRFVAQLSCIVPVKHYDYRPPLLSIDDLECGAVDLTRLPFETDSIGSLSCMHTVEHIGLGRYGDPLDCDGDIKAADELARVLLPGGNLLFVVPVGRSRIEFNAHRIYSYRQVLELFPSLQLKQYALIPDSHETGDILYEASEALTDSQNHGCGCFWFTKPAGK